MNIVKQYTEKDIIKKAQESLASVLSEVPFVVLKESKTEVGSIDKRIDLIQNILISGKPAKFIIEIKQLGEPRIMRMAVEQIKSYLKDFKNSYGIIVAPYLSDTSRQICKEAGIGCIDFAGNAFISFENIFINKTGLPNPFISKRISKSVFSPKSSRILRVLLSEPSKRWFVEGISKEAGVSLGLTSRVKQALLAEEWIKEENKKFYLVKPEEVLSQWANEYSYTKNQSFSCYSSLSEEQLKNSIRNECNKRKWQYGLTLFSGAKRAAPFVRSFRFFVYFDGKIDKIERVLQLKKVETGPNVTIFSPYDKGVFYGIQNIDGIKVVSDIQLYLDLKSYKGRGEEAAQAIFEQRIKPKW
jgi:hypothetical protein